MLWRRIAFIAVATHFCLIWVVESRVSLAEAILEDIFPPSSSQCVGSGTTSFGFNFTWSNASAWSKDFAHFEPELFLAELEHQEPNQNKTWRLRVGQGGNIYSYVGVYGEAMPPQIHKEAPWIDEVWQSVATNVNLNSADHPYMIHQAGAYQRDPVLLQRPFFSPNVAKHCAGRECRFVSWGQHAHVPTSHPSSTLYYNRYRDCGNGVLEVTAAIHNAAPPPARDATTLSYLNVPWGGVRASTFSDLLHAAADGSGPRLVEPLPAWGEAGGITQTAATGGYTTFAENLPLRPDLQFVLPCGDGVSKRPVLCSAANAQRVSLVVARDGPCSPSPDLTARWGVPTVACAIEKTVDMRGNGCRDCVLQFFIPGRAPGHEFMGAVLRWSHGGKSLLLWPTNTTADDINQRWAKGDVIGVRYRDTGRPAADNLALTFVHGRDGEWGVAANKGWMYGPSRLRVGKASFTRDYHVYTQNVFAYIRAGDTYFNRQYVLTDRFSDTHAHASSWLPHTQQSMALRGGGGSGGGGRNITLYSVAAAATTATAGPQLEFTAEVGNGMPQCLASGGGSGGGGSWVPQCNGSTTPRVGAQPLFHIRCGSQRYTGADQYHFASRNGTVVRPYALCDDGSRAVWTLLGFFPVGSCSALQSARYVADYCATVSPAAAPSPAPAKPTPPASAPCMHPADVVAQCRQQRGRFAWTCDDPRLPSNPSCAGQPGLLFTAAGKCVPSCGGSSGNAQ